MPSQELAAAVAMLGGFVIAVVSFVPFAAVRYRRRGRLSATDLLALVAVPVYGLALWTYTLLPLPDPADIVCQQALLNPFGAVDDIRAGSTDSLLDLVRNPAFLQVALNVVLFVPLGVILRWRWRRGWVTAGLVGFATSLLIETTQLTGIWGLYDCAYRFFDVDDLIANTSGALLGSAVSALVLRDRSPRRDERPLGLTSGRRAVALTSDVLTMVLMGAVAVVVWRVWMLEVRDIGVSDLDLTTQTRIQWGTPFLAEAVLVLLWGRTLGEAVVQVRTRARRPWMVVPARVVKLLTGVGAAALLAGWDTPVAGVGLVALGLANVAAVFLTSDHRGLSNTLAGLDVEIVDGPQPTAMPLDGT